MNAPTIDSIGSTNNLNVNDRFDRVDQTLTTALAEQTAAFQTELRKMYGVLLSAMVALATLVAAIVALSS